MEVALQDRIHLWLYPDVIMYIMGNNIQGQDEGGFIYLSQ